MSNKGRTISFASIQITSRCNLDCGFCFRRLNLPEVDTTTIKQVVLALRDLGVETIIITGGEPLLREDIVEVFRFIKEKGLKGVLQTNGLLLDKKKLKEIAPYLDWVSLSLDGEDPEIVSRMRSGKNYFRKNMDVLKEIKENYKIKVKVGTVITKVNYKKIEGLGKILNGMVDIWKLYQFFPRKGCNSEVNKNKYFIEDELFNKTARSIMEKYPGLNTAKHTIENYNRGPCLLVDPDGKTFISRHNDDFFVGNILQDPERLMSACEKLGVFDEIEKNFSKTYGVETNNS